MTLFVPGLKIPTPLGSLGPLIGASALQLLSVMTKVTQLIFFVLLSLGLSVAWGMDPWQTLLDKHHSMPAQLETSTYFEKFEIVPNKNSKIVLFNFELAKELGLLPADAPNHLTQELEQKILSTFDFKIDETGTLTGNRPQVFATYYSDGGLDYDSGTGDGRSVWLGEIKSRSEDGRERTFDINTKGTGRTGLGYEALAGHTDGLTHQPDILQEYYSGEVLYKSGISNASRVLVAIGTNEIRTLSDGKTKAPAGIMVRVSPTNLRFAHLWRYRSDPNKLRKLLEYHFSRDSLFAGRSFADQVKLLFSENIKNSAREMAFYDNFLYTQSSPTRGNRLINGQLVDFGGFNAFELFFADLYADPDLGTVARQKDFSKHWNQELLQILTTFVDLRSLNAEDLFQKIYDRTSLELNLIRLGFDHNEVSELIDKKPVDVRNISQAMQRLTALQTSNVVTVGKKSLRMPIFNLRKWLSDISLSRLLERDFLQLEEVLSVAGTFHSKEAYDSKLAHQEILIFQKTYRNLILALIDQKDKTQNREERLRAIGNRKYLRNSKTRSSDLVPRIARMRNYENLLKSNTPEEKLRSILSHEISSAIDFTADSTIPVFVNQHEGFVMTENEQGNQRPAFLNKTIKTPDWLIRLWNMHPELMREVPIRSEINSQDLSRISEMMLNAAWSSPKFGYLKIMLNRILQLGEIESQFRSLKDLVFVEGSEFKWSEAAHYRDLNMTLVKQRDSLPLIHEKKLLLSDSEFRLLFRGTKTEFSMTLLNSAGEVVLIDGPRKLYIQPSSQKWLLTSSLVATFVNPAYRNRGLYQAVLSHYTEELPAVQKMFLVSENIETMDLAARIFDMTCDSEKLRLLMKMKSIQSLFADLKIDPRAVTNLEPEAIGRLRNYLMLLSLQGKSRLKTGWGLETEDTFSGRFWSSKLSAEEVKIGDHLVRSMETELGQSMENSTEGFYKLFPVSYQKFLARKKLMGSESKNPAFDIPAIPLRLAPQCRFLFSGA